MNSLHALNIMEIKVVMHLSHILQGTNCMHTDTSFEIKKTHYVSASYNVLSLDEFYECVGL